MRFLIIMSDFWEIFTWNIHQDRDIIKAFFGLGTGQALSLDEISEQYHLTRERVRQIKDKALARLRNNKPLVKELQAYL